MSTEYATISTGGDRGMARSIALRMAKETCVFLVGRTKAICAWGQI